MKKIVLLLVLVGVGISVGLIVLDDPDPEMVISDTENPAEEQNPASENAQIAEVEVAPLEYSIDDEDSIWLVVNKVRPISLTYEPTDLRRVDVTVREDKSAAELSLRDEAAAALEALFADAEADGLFLLMGSGFRDAELQEFYYTNYVNAFGQAEADKFSARPGTSEHQIGLAADVSPATQFCYLETCFAETPEGQWVRDNAHLHGFVIRYPLGKEVITGYQFEPWHLRFVGVELATELYETSQTLEEYFEL